MHGNTETAVAEASRERWQPCWQASAQFDLVGDSKLGCGRRRGFRQLHVPGAEAATRIAAQGEASKRMHALMPYRCVTKWGAGKYSSSKEQMETGGG